MRNKQKRAESNKRYANSKRGKEVMKMLSHDYYQKHKEKLYLRHRNYVKSRPWLRTFYSINSRCTNPNHFAYKYYGGKGIKNLLTPLLIKELWFRDKAFLLKNPSIDRIDSAKDYSFSNCRFIELSENSRRAHPKTRLSNVA